MTTAPTYQKLVGTLGNRAFVDSSKPIGVTPTSANSIRQVQLIGAEANFVTNTFNILAETFPQLDIQPMELVELDAQLDGRPEELAAQFTAAKKKAKQQPKAGAKPAPAKAEPVQEEVQTPPKEPTIAPNANADISSMSDEDLRWELRRLDGKSIDGLTPEEESRLSALDAEYSLRYLRMGKENISNMSDGDLHDLGNQSGSDEIWALIDTERAKRQKDRDARFNQDVTTLTDAQIREDTLAFLVVRTLYKQQLEKSLEDLLL